MELLKTLNHINESMCDNESRKIFNARLKYSMFKNEREFIEEIGIMERELVCIEWENFARTLSENVNIVIFGADCPKTRLN